MERNREEKESSYQLYDSNFIVEREKTIVLIVTYVWMSLQQHYE